MSSTVADYFHLLAGNIASSTFSLRAVRDETVEHIDRAAFARLCRIAADAVRAAGVRPKETVLLFLSHDRHILPLFFGIQWAGAIPSFMPPLSPRQDPEGYRKSHQALIRHINPALIIADEGVVNILGGDHKIPMRGVHELLRSSHSEWLEPPDIDLDDIALLQHSSGTTGLKKGIALTYRSILAHVDSLHAALQISGNESIVTWLPVYHDMGLLACTVVPFVLGLPVVSMNPFEWMAKPHRILELAAQFDNSLIWLPNFAFNHLVRFARRLPERVRLDGVKAFINCSEPCKVATFDLFYATFAARGVTHQQLQTCYGMAENVFAATHSTLNAVAPRVAVDALRLQHHGVAVAPAQGADTSTFLSCGRAIDGVRIEVRNAGGVALPEGHVGEVCVTGSSLFDGYFRQPALTARRVRDGWYHSHDLGFRLGGELYICGRMDDLIIVAGRNLYAHDIEACVTCIDGVRPGRSVAFGVSNDVTGTEDLIVLVETAQPDDTHKQLQHDIRTVLSDEILLVPSVVLVLEPDTLIKTTSGKISRDENRNRYLQGNLISWGRV